MSGVFVLTVRQLAGSRRIWLVLALVSLPLLAGLLFQVADATATPDEFGDDVTRVMLASAILPLVMLLLATVAVGGIPVALGGALAVAVIERGDGGGALATGAGLLAGAAAYAAIFTWAGLTTRHALLIGLVYVFIWEAALAAYLDGIRFLSVRRYTLALIHALDNGRLASADISLSPLTAAVGTTLVLVGFTALAVRKLMRMDVP